MNNDIEIESNNVSDLRGLMADRLDRLGVACRIVGLRSEFHGAQA
jgi:hypothetical protein